MLTVGAVEQEFIYLLNRARQDPVAYDRQQNLPVNLSSIVPRGPLAVNTELSNSADVKASDMARAGYFSHVSPTGVYPNQLVRDAGYDLITGAPDQANWVESIGAGTNHDNASSVLDLLIIDEGVPDLGHRRHLFSVDDFWQANRDIGVGYSTSSTAAFTNYWAIHIGQRDPQVNSLTGVVFDDLDGDSQYDAGEGLSGVTITVNGTTTTRTNPAGGWSVPVADGEHTVVANGGNFSGYSSVNATVSGDNVQVDFISGNVAGQVSFAEAYGTNIGSIIDVNANGTASALDALIVINHIAAAQAGGSRFYGETVFLDVNNDNSVTLVDALQVINGVARAQSRSSGEGIFVSPFLEAFTIASDEDANQDWIELSPGLTNEESTQFRAANVETDSALNEAEPTSPTSENGRDENGPDPLTVDQAILSL